MGLISGLIAEKNIQKIKMGGIANLSIADIAMLITNLPDAKRNLTSEQFEAVHKLFKEFQTCTTKMPMDAEAYVDTAIKIIKRYDEIAPYEKFSGGSEMEFSFLMEDIRKADSDKAVKSQIAHETESMSDKLIKIANSNTEKFGVEGYINYVIKESKKFIPAGLPYNDVKAFCGINISKELYGEEVALNYFYKFADEMVDSVDDANSSIVCSVLSFLSGLLYPNGITTKENSSIISIVYNNRVLQKVLPIEPYDSTISKLNEIADVDTRYKLDEYINFLIPKVKEYYGIEVSYDWLKVLMGLVVLSEHQGKECAIQDLDIIANHLLSTSDDESYHANAEQIGVLCKLLFENSVITVQEKLDLYKRYNVPAVKRTS